MPAQTVQEVKRILRLDVEYEKAIQRLGEYKAKIEEINKQMKDLKRQIASGSMSPRDVKSAQTQMAALDTQVRVLKKDEQELTKATQNTIKVQREQDNSLRSLRAQLSNLTREFDGLSAAERRATQGQNLQKQINEVTTKLKDAEMATQRFYRNVGNYQDALQGIEKLKSGFMSLGSVITGMLGALGLQSVGSSMLAVARDFEDSISRVRAVANPMMTEFMDLRDKALELGATTRYTAGEVARGMEELARKGLTAKQTLDSIMPTLQLAQANMVSVADAAQISSSTMRAFGMQTEDLIHINDVLSSTCAHSASTLGLMSEAMKTAGPVAKTANVSLSETAALIGSLANVGMTGSDAGTGIKQIILALSSAATTKKGAKVLEHYNIQLDEARIKAEGLLPVLREMKEKGLGESLTDLQKLTGKYASPRIANLINNIDEAIELNETLQNSLGENERMFKQSLSPLSNSIFQLQSAWQNFMTNMEHSSDSVFVKVIDGLTEIVRFLNKFPGLVLGVIGAIVSAKAFTPLAKGIVNSYQQAAAAAKATAKEEEMVNEDKLRVLQQQEREAGEKIALTKREMLEKEFQLKQAKLQEEARVVEINANKEIALASAAETRKNSIVKVGEERGTAIIAAAEKRNTALLVRELKERLRARQISVLEAQKLTVKSNPYFSIQEIQTVVKNINAEIAKIRKQSVNELKKIDADYRQEVLRTEQEIADKKIEINNKYNSDVARINRNAIRAEENNAQERIRIEREVATKKEQLEKEVAEANKVANEKKVLQDKKASQESMTLWQRAGTAAKNSGKVIIAGLGGIKSALGGIVSMLKFQIWIAAITTMVELFGKMWANTKAVDNNLKEMNQKINDFSNSETLRRVTAIRDRIRDLLSIQNRSEEQQEELNRLLGTAAEYANSRKIDEQNVLGILNNQILALKEQNRLYEIRQSMLEDSANALRSTVNFGMEAQGLNSPEDIRKIARMVANETGSWVAYREFSRNFIPGFGYGYTKKNGKKVKWTRHKGVFDRNDAAIEEFYDTIKRRVPAKDLAGVIKSITEFVGMGDLEDLKQQSRQFNRKAQMISAEEYYAVPDKNKPVTTPGDYDPANWGRGKGRGKTPPDYEQWLQSLLAKYRDTTNDAIAQTTFDTVKKQMKVAQNAVSELKENIYKIVGSPEGYETKYNPVNKWKEASKQLPELAQSVQEAMTSAIRAEIVRRQIEIDNLTYEASKRQYNIDKEGWDARIALAKSKLAEWVLITGDNVISEMEKTLKQEEEIYKQETISATAAYNRAREEREKAFVTSGLAVANRDENGNYVAADREMVLAGYEEYLRERKEIEEKYKSGEISQEEYDEKIKALDDFYSAEHHYYEMEELASERHQQDMRNKEVEHQKMMAQIKYNGLKKQNDIIIQGMQNQLASLQMGYDEQTNANHDYYTKAKFGEDEYWKEIVWMVGERQAEEFRLQYEAAKKEYDFIEKHGKQTWETEEEYEKRRIDAKKKMVDIETKVNNQIFSNQQAVIQSTNAMVGSFGELASAMIEDEKEKAEAMKAFTLMQAMLQLALSIANIAEKASQKGAFGIPEAIAGIAEITSIFATVFSTINSANANGYAKGGKVHGPGTETSDSIPAKLSDGEFVMTAKATKLFEPLLMAMNGIGAGVALPRNNYVQTRQSADLTDAFARAAQEITPVVDVREVTRAQNRVKTIQNLGSYKL